MAVSKVDIYKIHPKNLHISGIYKINDDYVHLELRQYTLEDDQGGSKSAMFSASLTTRATSRGY